MLKKIGCLCLLLLLIFSNLVSLGNSIAENGTINVPHSTNIPNIDGQWSTPIEWLDASENIIQNEFEWTFYIRLKHNQTHLFALLDFISDQGYSTTDTCGICFDTDNDGGNFPDLGDYEFHWAHGGQFYSYTEALHQGTGKGGGYNEAMVWISPPMPLGTEMERSFSSTHDPYEDGRDHEIYEFQIPCSFLGENYFFGFYAYVYDSTSDTLLEWPVDAGGVVERVCRINVSAPGNWGNIESDVKFIPEFPSFGILLSLFIVAIPFIIIFRRRMRLY